MSADSIAKKPSGLDGKPQLLLTTALIISKVVVVLVAVLSIALSVLAGASYLKAVMRGGAAAMIVGLLAWFINWYLERTTLEQVQARCRARMGTPAQNAAEWKA